MEINSQCTSPYSNTRFDKRVRFFFILFVFIGAFVVRLHHINRPPLDFSPIRQYQNAHISRGLYYTTNHAISETRKEIARINAERMGFLLEPRIIESIAVLGYRIMGAEQLWIPRVMSSLFWVVGGLFLYLISRQLFSSGIALFAASFYLFLPYGILASRSIQPDPLMIMMMLVSIYGIIKNDEDPSRLRFFSAALVSAAAVLIKPYCIFIIFGAYFSLSVVRMGLLRVLLQRNTHLFVFLMMLPSLMYYGYNVFTSSGFVGEHVQGSFLPHLLLRPSFWQGWLDMIGLVVGYIAFLSAVLGFLTSQDKRLKALLAGLCIGYLLFGISATYQIHTHAYYSLPLIPIIALSLGALGQKMVDRRALLFTIGMTITIAIVFGLIILLSGIGMRHLSFDTIISEYKSEVKTVAKFIGVPPAFIKFLSDNFEKEVRIAKEIGDHVGHSTNTVFLTPYFGRVIAYHGEFSGLPWPTSQSLYGRSLRGARSPRLKDDFTLSHMVLLYQGRYITYTPDYFIITAFDEYDRQFDLKEFLTAHFPLLQQSDDYLIFDLRKMSEEK